MIPTKAQILLLVVSSTLVEGTSLRKRNAPSRRLEDFNECLVLKSVIEYEDAKVAAENGDKEICSCLMENGNPVELENLGDDLCSKMISSVSTISSTFGFLFDPETQHAEVPAGAALQTTTIEEEGVKGRNRRRLQVAVGNQKVLIVRAVASDSATTSSEAKLKEEVLGIGGSDVVNFSSQYDACSYGQLTFSASSLGNGNGGAYTVSITESTSGSDNGVIRNAMNTKWQNDLGSYSSQDDLDYVIMCIPPGTNGGWIAYAYINHWLSVYNDRWCEYPSALMHEVGHNLGLAHSGEGNNEYADQSGLMGYSYSQDEGPVMCFNGVKTWKLNWFPAFHQPVESDSSYYWQGDLIGFNDRDQAGSNDKMIFKLNPKTENNNYEYYVHFNRANGFNSGTREGGNRVLVARRERGTAYRASYILAKMGSNGSYTISNFGDEGDLTINVGDIILNSQSKSAAKVTIQYGETSPQTPAPVPQTPAPVPQTPAPVPQTPAPVPQTPAPVPSPNQPQSPATWGIDRIDQRDLPLNDSYGVSGDGNGVTAYILDTGILHAHDEFEGRARFGTNEVADGNTEDCHGHGTHVAGTVGGKEFGVAKKVDLVSVKVLGCSGGGSTAGVVRGIDWVLSDAEGKTATANMSLGGGKSTAINEAVERLVQSGVPTVVAAGNSNADACNYSPASEPSAITVGSTDINDSRSSFSNYGDCLDIYAPGRNIESAWIDSTSSTRTISGTSMASPHVCGGVALLLQAGVSHEDINTELSDRSTKDKVTDPRPGSPNKLLYVGEVGPTNAPTPEPPTPAPTPCISSEITVEVTTDNYPQETGWSIVNKANPNELVMSKAEGAYTNQQTTYTDTGCIASAEYEFTITDSYGDGICCSYGSGSYMITYDGAVVAEGGQFGGSETKEFGEVVEPTPSPVNPTQPPVSVAPVTAPTGSPVEDPFQTIFEEKFEDEEYEMANVGKKRVDSSKNPTIGDYSLRLKKKQNIMSKMKNVRNYSTLKIDFKFYGKGMEDDEYFILQSKLNGSPWTEKGRWVKGVNKDFDNGEWKDGTVLLEVGNKKKMKFRIKAFGNQANDQIFLDDIVLSGLP